MTRYLIDIFHKEVDYYLTTNYQFSVLCNILGNGNCPIYTSSKIIPQNWIGYNKNNPTPGYDIRSHRWEITCNEEDLNMIILKTGGKVVNAERFWQESL